MLDCKRWTSVIGRKVGGGIAHRGRSLISAIALLHMKLKEIVLLVVN